MKTLLMNSDLQPFLLLLFTCKSVEFYSTLCLFYTQEARELFKNPEVLQDEDVNVSYWG